MENAEKGTMCALRIISQKGEGWRRCTKVYAIPSVLHFASILQKVARKELWRQLRPAAAAESYVRSIVLHPVQHVRKKGPSCVGDGRSHIWNRGTKAKLRLGAEGGKTKQEVENSAG